MVKVESVERYIEYAQKNKLEEIEFYITKPFNKKRATYGNGTQVSFLVDASALVDKFHAIALKNGGLNEGMPGSRPSSSVTYYSYIRDPDGNKTCAYTNIL